MVEHLKSTYALANATDTTLLDECLEPADMAVPVGTALASFDAKLALVNEHVSRPYNSNNAKTMAFLGKYPAEIQAKIVTALDNDSSWTSVADRELNDDRADGFRVAFVRLLESRRAAWVTDHGAVKAANPTKPFKAAKGGCWAHGDCAHTTAECTWIAAHAGFEVLKTIKAQEHTVTHHGKKIKVGWHFLANGKDPTTATGLRKKKGRGAGKKAEKADAADDGGEST